MEAVTGADCDPSFPEWLRVRQQWFKHYEVKLVLVRPVKAILRLGRNQLGLVCNIPHQMDNEDIVYESRTTAGTAISGAAMGLPHAALLKGRGEVNFGDQ